MQDRRVGISHGISWRADELGTLADMPIELAIGLGAVLAVVVGLNIYASVRILRDELLGRGQRIIQIAVVWILPLIGAVVALWHLREEKFESRRFESPGPDSDIGMRL